MVSKVQVVIFFVVHGVLIYRWLLVEVVMALYMFMIQLRWVLSRNVHLIWLYRYRLPGHRSIVNDVDFHPIEPIICSVSSDHSVLLGEILPWFICWIKNIVINIHYWEHPTSWRFESSSIGDSSRFTLDRDCLSDENFSSSCGFLQSTGSCGRRK